MGLLPLHQIITKNQIYSIPNPANVYMFIQIGSDSEIASDIAFRTFLEPFVRCIVLGTRRC